MGETEAYQGPLALEKEEVVSFIVALGGQQAVGTDLMCSCAWPTSPHL